MRLPDLFGAVEAYGVQMPFGRVNHSGFYDDLLNLEPIGSGVARLYSAWHVRRLVAWLKIGEVTGVRGHGNQYRRTGEAERRRQAMRLLASATEGYVVMSQGRAWWSLAPPVHAIKEMALVFPAIQWRPEHSPR